MSPEQEICQQIYYNEFNLVLLNFSYLLLSIDSLRSRKRYAKEQFFIDSCLANHPKEVVEDVSAVVHETNRIPDSRILIVEDGQILNFFGIPVDEYVEKSSYLGALEYSALKQIKNEANNNINGAEISFSAPFPEQLPPEKRKYPVAKVDIGEIRYSSDHKTKVLLKKAILLDISSEILLGLANTFADKIGLKRFNSVEELRSNPVFCTEDELEDFFDMVAECTNQIAQVENETTLEINFFQSQ